MMVTAAPGTTAPAASVTVPRIVPVSTCALAAIAHNANVNHTIDMRLHLINLAVFIPFPPASRALLAHPKLDVPLASIIYRVRHRTKSDPNIVRALITVKGFFVHVTEKDGNLQPSVRIRSPPQQPRKAVIGYPILTFTTGNVHSS